MINQKMQAKKSFDMWLYIIICAMFCEILSLKSKAAYVFPKHILKFKASDQSKQVRKKLFCHMIINNYLYNVLCKFLIKGESTWRHEIKAKTLLLTLLYCGRTVSMVHCFIYLKVQGLDCITVSGFRNKATSLFFLLLGQHPWA